VESAKVATKFLKMFKFSIRFADSTSLVEPVVVELPTPSEGWGREGTP